MSRRWILFDHASNIEYDKKCQKFNMASQKLLTAIFGLRLNKIGSKLYGFR